MELYIWIYAEADTYNLKAVFFEYFRIKTAEFLCNSWTSAKEQCGYCTIRYAAK